MAPFVFKEELHMNWNKTKLQLVSICLLALILTVLVMCGAIRDIGPKPEPVGAYDLVEAEFVSSGDGLVEIEDVETVAVEPEVAAVETDIVEVSTEPIVEQVATDAAVYIAKTVYGEARGLGQTDQAAVVWCILNRVDAYGSDIVSVVTAPNQFHGYSAGNPVTDDIYWLVNDVLQRWQNEKAGASDVGRVLPKEYLYFYGDGVRNHYRTAYRGGTTWNWGLASPYVN